MIIFVQPPKDLTQHIEEFIECKGLLKGLPDEESRLVEHMYALLGMTYRAVLAPTFLTLTFSDCL